MHDVATKLRNGMDICLAGACGVGKTHMACSILRSACRHSSGRYCSALELSSRVRATYHESPRRTEYDVLAPLKACKFLVIDDWQYLGELEGRHRIFFDLFDSRYREGLPTLVILNSDERRVATLLGPQVTSRISGSGEFVYITWPSFRANAHKEG
ncbi:MAG: hypothetical protein GIKADHBN_02654 [Phycisphaerales bacterium]|nr:hypothetical protein [Phycisphaerales bacterium]